MRLYFQEINRNVCENYHAKVILVVMIEYSNIMWGKFKLSKFIAALIGTEEVRKLMHRKI